MPAGARAAVMGPSGAGKSTLLEALAGFVPAEGRMEWDGAPLSGPPGARPVAMLFQDGNLFPHLSVRRNAGLGIRPDGRLGRADRARVDEALGRVGLSGMEDRLPAALSGGQRGRAALARALLMRRPLLLLDEPFAALGPRPQGRDAGAGGGGGGRDRRDAPDGDARPGRRARHRDRHDRRGRRPGGPRPRPWPRSSPTRPRRCGATLGREKARRGGAGLGSSRGARAGGGVTPRGCRASPGRPRGRSGAHARRCACPWPRPSPAPRCACW